MATVTSLKPRLRRILKAGFPGAKIVFHDESSVGKLGGMLIWNGFVGKDQVDRQRALRELLEKHLDPDQRGQLGGIFTMTSYEMDVINESSRAD